MDSNSSGHNSIELTRPDMQKMEQLFNYMSNHWLGAGRGSFSVFGLESRTNNCQESYHRKLNSLIRCNSNPNVWTLLVSLKDLAASYHLDVLRLETGNPIRRNRKTKWLKQNANIREAQQKLTAEPPLMTVGEFLSSMAHRFGDDHLPVLMKIIEEIDETGRRTSQAAC